MQLEFYQRVNKALHHGAVAIATVIEINGSVPREVGAKMMIEPTGITAGTIGGGAGEASIIEAAIALLQNLDSSDSDFSAPTDQASGTAVTIDLTGATQRQTQGVCGGTMQVWVSCWLSSWGRAIAQALCQRLTQGKTTLLVTPLHSAQLPYWQEPFPSTSSTVEEPEVQTSPEHDPNFSIPMAEFIEYIRPNPTLLIVGGGHVGIALAEAATFAGFRIIVQDDRPEFAEAHRFQAISPNVEVSAEAIATVLKDFAEVDELYIALVTRGVIYDLQALECLLSPDMAPVWQRIRYIGMMGSLKRIRYVFQCLEKKGLASDRLNTIHAPIGVEIGALTPAEIAISICAELVQTRRKSVNSSSTGFPPILN